MICDIGASMEPETRNPDLVTLSEVEVQKPETRNVPTYPARSISQNKQGNKQLFIVVLKLACQQSSQT
jgi:hypothetical protein